MSNWESSAKWYNEIVSEEGHYYHSKVILPKLLKLFRFTDKSSLLDIGCGQGILSRKIPPHIRYVGLDGSKQMIKNAKRLRSDAAFYHKDATLPFDIEEKDFSHACFLLSFQNIHAPLKALREVRKTYDQ